MAKIPTSISIEKDLKEQSAALFEKLNLDMSTAVGMFLSKCVQNKGLPFNVELGPYAAAVVSGEQDYNDSPIVLGTYWTLEDWAAKHIHYYEDNIAKEALSGLYIVHIMFAIMSIAREMFQTPGELALDIASSIFDREFQCYEDTDKALFNSIKIFDPQQISYKLVCGPGENEVAVIKGFPACTLYRIEQAMKSKRGEGYELQNEDIFKIIQYPLGWIYAIAQNRAKFVVKNGRRVSPKDMEFLVNGIMEEIAIVKRDYDLNYFYPDIYQLGCSNNVECNIPE